MTPSAVEIRQVETLTGDQQQQLTGWGDNIFGTADLDLAYRAKDLHFLLYDGEDGPLSHAAVLRHRATVNGFPALIGGIGGVVTIPSAQKRGYATLLMRHATNFLANTWNVDFALLFCIDRMVPYYERLGWRKVTCEVLLDESAGKVRCPFNVMTVPFKSEFEVVDSLDLGSASW